MLTLLQSESAEEMCMSDELHVSVWPLSSVPDEDIITAVASAAAASTEVVEWSPRICCCLNLLPAKILHLV